MKRSELAKALAQVGKGLYLCQWNALNLARFILIKNVQEGSFKIGWVCRRRNVDVTLYIHNPALSPSPKGGVEIRVQR
jgi:hypothetical protein